MIAILVPILISLGLFALIFGIVYMNKRESLAMLDKGMDPRTRGASGPEPFKYLKWGLLMIGSGVGLLAAFFIDFQLRPHDPEALYFALIAIGGGVGLIVSYKMEMKELKESRRNTTSVPGPSEL